MTGLPAGPAEPLHILEPWPWQRGLIIVLLVAAGLMLVRWLRRRLRSADRTETKRVAPPVPSAFEGAVARLLSHAHGSRNYRRGCHELARLLCAGLAVEHGDRVQAMTARELVDSHGESPLTRLLLLLSDLRFGRREVRKRDLEGACELALESNPGSRGRKR